MNGYMTTKMELYTSWNSTVGWGWGIISTIRAFKEGNKGQTINLWLYE